MGNCLKHQSSTQHIIHDAYEGDELEFSTPKGDFEGTNKGVASTTKTITEVKIKITKKQLEELLSKVDVRELKVDQVLSHLMNHSGGGYQQLQRPWRPALQSIPELN
ncbi:hypothetical protein VNO77_43009 [Canavalia gladiata]|uniref:Uncharacterized protein n=1 Tax=Canavalia gladiata TaxID=3824 RepID=A0AAN9JWX9_CANGL